jgi:hypothetical protein
MANISHVLLALKDFKKANDFFLHMGLTHFTSATMRDKPSPEILAGRQPAEPDRVHVMVDSRGFCMDLTIWYETMRRFYGSSDLFCMRVAKLDQVWASLKTFPGVRLLSPPSTVSQEMVKAIGDNLKPGRFAMISVDLDREDGKEQLIELIEGLVPDHLA